MSGAAVTLGDFIFLVGGVGVESGQGATLLRYDPSGNTWTRLAKLTNMREHIAAVVLSGRIFALGGRWDTAELSTVEIYDPASEHWSPGPSMAVARAGHGAAVLHEQIVVAGGEVILAGNQTLDSVEVLDPATGAWSAAPVLPTPVHGVPAATVDGTLFTLGGSSRAGGIANNGQVFAYRP
jgi:hypothetical protein